MMHTKSEALLTLGSEKKKSVRRKHALKRRYITFLKDFNFYIDYCLARYAMWRALRRRQKALNG